MIKHDVDSDFNGEVFSIELDNEPLLECLLHHPHLPDEIVFALDYPILHSQQFQVMLLLQQQQQQHQQNNLDKYPTINLGGMELICFDTTQGEPWCIAIPDTLLDLIINLYH